MNPLQHPSEEDLIAYRLDEGGNQDAIRKHLESCDDCARLFDSIAQTLRVFSAAPVPEADLDRNWHRLRGNLPVLHPARSRRFGLPAWLWPAAGFALAATALLLFVTLKPRHAHSSLRPGDVAMINRPGPLTAKPRDPQIAEQLDSAERLLTAVNHTTGSIDDAERSQAHDLLLKNAVYIQTARDQGDLGTASVLEDLGRVLTNIDHAPKSEDTGWDLRVEWNTKGLLLDIRILRQNDSRL
jgi:hypothetical protein